MIHCTKYFLPAIVALFLNISSLHSQEKNQNKEIIYHVLQRSFYDSNGDLHGDLNGLNSKLDYLQELGVTSILLLPLYESVYYHNYFSGNFEKIDDEYGSMQDYINLVKAIHQRGMKIYLDMETQYITEDHLWWKDSYGNPSSKYSDYLVYNDSAHTKPETIIFNLTELKGYDGSTKKITTVNMLSNKVLEYNYTLFAYFIDPDKNGKFDDGVDGFRLDHMMDDLDWKGKFKPLFSQFWTPLLTRLKQLNPSIKIVAEQANWASFGLEYFDHASVDRVFAFRLQQAITSFDKNKIAAMADTTFSVTPDNHQQVVFIENHDMQRFASTVNKNINKEKTAALLNLLLGGIPSIYYGQELGMYGSGGFGKFGNTDGNDIPMREAFEWYKSDTGKGMALWYKNSGPWWDSTNLHPNDGISLEEERNNPNSLWNFYRQIIKLRQSNEALTEGSYKTLQNDNAQVFSFLRYTKNKAVAIVLNLSDAQQKATVNLKGETILQHGKNLFGTANTVITNSNLQVDLPAYGATILQVQ